jgi:hypothetical protein
MAKPKPRPRPRPTPAPRPRPRPPKPLTGAAGVGQKIDNAVKATAKFVRPAVKHVKKVYHGDLSGIRNLERKVSTKVGKAYNQSLGFKGKNKTVNKYVGRAVGATGYMIGSTGVSLYKSYGDQKKEASGK